MTFNGNKVTKAFVQPITRDGNQSEVNKRGICAGGASRRAFKLITTEIVLQPTSFCNLNCHYCYLPDKDRSHRMDPEITRRVCDHIRKAEEPTLVLWHCGEPLSTGVPHFRSLLEPFEDDLIRSKTRHLVQTNATLIDEAWCELFKQYNFQLGVSIDGPANLNTRRLTRAGHETHSKALMGIELLRRNGLKFSVIAVVGKESLKSAKELYLFVRDLGAEMLCINIEETEGINRSQVITADEARGFWKALYNSWEADMGISIREFSKLFNSMDRIVKTDYELDGSYRTIEMIPTISTRGDVVVLSPEFLGMEKQSQSFVVGNVLARSLEQILKSATDYWYVRDYATGIERCRKECQYFVFCGGGYASNKYFENGEVSSTETHFCRNKDKALVEAVLEVMEHE